MRNDVVSIFDAAVGRLLAGVLNLSSAHPVVVAVMLAVLTALVCTVWMETMGVRLQRTPAQQDRPIRPWRS